MKRLLRIGLLFFVLLAVQAVAQPVVEEWVARYNGPGNGDDWASLLAVDGAGNVYVTGRSSGGGTPYTSDYATVKYDPNGHELWVARYDGPGNYIDEARALAVDSAGNVYVTGTSATVKYDTEGNELWVANVGGSALAVDSAGNVYVTGISEGDYTTVKYDAAGVEQWVMRYNGPANSTDRPSALAVDGDGNVYVTGESFVNEDVFDIDYATVKYDTNGHELWAARYDADHDWDSATTLAVDGAGNVYVTGYSNGSGTSGFDYATIKYDLNGNELWVARYDGPATVVSSGDWAYALAVDGAGNVYVTGESGENSTFEDYATVKYDPNGHELWAARYNGPANSSDWATALAVDGAGNVYVMGTSEGSGGRDYATVKYDTNGHELWVARYDGPGNYIDEARALLVDSAGNVYVTGTSWSGTGTDYATVKYSQPQTSPNMAVSPDAYDFGDVLWRQTRTAVFTLSNDGGGALTLSGIALGDTPEGFSITTAPSLPHTLNGGEATTVKVAFSPQRL